MLVTKFPPNSHGFYAIHIDQKFIMVVLISAFIYQDVYIYIWRSVQVFLFFAFFVLDYQYTNIYRYTLYQVTSLTVALSAGLPGWNQLYQIYMSDADL